MAQTESSERIDFPYVSYKTFRNYLESLKQFFPNRIDRSALRNLSGHNQLLLINALRSMRLIDDTDRPADTLRQLVEAESTEAYRQVLGEVAAKTYPTLLGDDSGFDLARATPAQFNEKFKGVGSGDTVRKCQAFFVAMATDAGLPISPPIKEGRRGTTRARSTAKRSRANGNTSANGEPNKGTQSPPTSDNNSQKPPEPPPLTVEQQLMQDVISMFPTFENEWDLDEKKLWFEEYRHLREWLGSVKSKTPVKENEAES